MTRQIVIALIALAAGVGIGLWMAEDEHGGHDGHGEAAEAQVYRCPMHPTVVSDRPGTCPVCDMDLVADAPARSPSTAGERTIAYWRAPMDPSYTSSEPGKSPMGMDLIPVYEDELQAAGTVRIDPAAVQSIGVRTAPVEVRALRRHVRTVGRVDYDETRLTDVNTKVAGWVEKLFVDYTGKAVGPGDPLLEIYSPVLVAAQEEYLTGLDYWRRLQAQGAGEEVLRGAQELVAASEQRLRLWDVQEAQIERLRREGQVRRTMVVYSPQQGTVVHKAVLDGAYIQPGQHLYRIADLSHVWVHADVYEADLAWVDTGAETEVRLNYLPGQSFAGRVTYIYPFLDPKTRTVKARMQYDNAEGRLKPEMYASVTILAPPRPPAPAIPEEAVIHSGERTLAVVSLGEGRFQPREIAVGVQAEGMYEVLEGLREGERIVTSAQFLIDSESNLKAAVRALTSGDAATAGHEH